jgi:hypothetical protein
MTNEPVAKGPYVTALERLVKAVESHKEAGFPPFPECDEALAEAQTALTGLRYSGDMERIEQAERDAASARDHLIRTARKGS